MPTEQGPSYPVFEWSYGFEDGIRGGELHAWPSHGGSLVFQSRREDYSQKFQSVKEALKGIEEYGWGKPPHIDEVFQDIIELQKKIPADTIEEAERIFKELRRKWESLATS